jgi:hypothetical protein
VDKRMKEEERETMEERRVVTKVEERGRHPTNYSIVEEKSCWQEGTWGGHTGIGSMSGSDRMTIEAVVPFESSMY